MPDDLSSYLEGDLVFNGVNAITGDYGQPPLSKEKLARLIRGAPLPADYRTFVDYQKKLAALAQVPDRLQRVTEAEANLEASRAEARLAELRYKVQNPTEWPTIPGAGDPTQVANAGWGAIFPADMNPSLKATIVEALQPLFDLRQSQAGDLFRIYDGGDAYRSGERKSQYFERMGVGPGLADPRQMPFYLLLVGSPEEIPYSFQYQLDVMRAVGRLDFGSDVEAYHDYALSVVLAESGDIVLPRRAALFAPMNRGDKATNLSAQLLVQPLYENLLQPAPDFDVALEHAWEVQPPLMGEGQATHEALQRLLGGDAMETPSLLFTASHGIELPANHPAQTRQQGALLCQDWPGLGADVLRNHYFAAEDVHPSADLTGMMALFFACYGAGTPQMDQFAAQAFKVREKIAPHGFTAALPQRLLKQGALAVIGHVERAWGYSFISPQGRQENQTFITAMRTLMNGDPIGVATDSSFNMRYAALSSDLSADLEELTWNPSHLSDYELAYRWTANNDARSYVVLGDPAARLPVTEPERPPAADTITILEPADEPEPVVEEPAPEVEEPAPTEEPEPVEAPEEVERPTPTEEPAPVDEAGSEPVVDESVDDVAVDAALQPVDAGAADDLPPWEEPAPAEPEAVEVAVSETVPGGAESPVAPTIVAETRAEPAPSEASPPPIPTTKPTPTLTVEEPDFGADWEQVTLQREPLAPGVLSDYGAVGYGLKDEFENLKTSLKAFTDQLATSLGNAASDIVTLDVRTYSTQDIAGVSRALDNREEAAAVLRALTRINFDGDLQVYVPEKVDQGVDPSLWLVHKAMVEEAQSSRAVFLATMADLAARLLDSLRIG